MSCPYCGRMSCPIDGSLYCSLACRKLHSKVELRKLVSLCIENGLTEDAVELLSLLLEENGVNIEE